MWHAQGEAEALGLQRCSFMLLSRGQADTSPRALGSPRGTSLIPQRQELPGAGALPRAQQAQGWDEAISHKSLTRSSSDGQQAQLYVQDGTAGTLVQLLQTAVTKACQERLPMYVFGRQAADQLWLTQSLGN